MEPHILAAGIVAALPAFQIVGGIDGFTLGAGIVGNHFSIPCFKSRFLSAGLRLPEFDPVRRLGLKLLQLFAGIFRAVSAKIHAFS